MIGYLLTLLGSGASKFHFCRKILEGCLFIAAVVGTHPISSIFIGRNNISQIGRKIGTCCPEQAIYWIVLLSRSTVPPY
jgi:hypothetical protein